MLQSNRKAKPPVSTSTTARRLSTITPSGSCLSNPRISGVKTKRMGVLTRSSEKIPRPSLGTARKTQNFAPSKSADIAIKKQFEALDSKLSILISQCKPEVVEKAVERNTKALQDRVTNFFRALSDENMRKLSKMLKKSQKVGRIHTEESRGRREDSGNKEFKETREIREIREAREIKEFRDFEEARRIKEIREAKEAREAREYREAKEAKEARELREEKQAKKSKETKDYRELKEAKESKESMKPSESRSSIQRVNRELVDLSPMIRPASSSKRIFVAESVGRIAHQARIFYTGTPLSRKVRPEDSPDSKAGEDSRLGRRSVESIGRESWRTPDESMKQAHIVQLALAPKTRPCLTTFTDELMEMMIEEACKEFGRLKTKIEEINRQAEPIKKDIPVEEKKEVQSKLVSDLKRGIELRKISDLKVGIELTPRDKSTLSFDLKSVLDPTRSAEPTGCFEPLQSIDSLPPIDCSPPPASGFRTNFNAISSFADSVLAHFGNDGRPSRSDLRRFAYTNRRGAFDAMLADAMAEQLAESKGLGAACRKLTEIGRFMVGLMPHEDSFLALPSTIDEELLAQLREDRFLRFLIDFLKENEPSQTSLEPYRNELALEVAESLFDSELDDIVKFFAFSG